MKRPAGDGAGRPGGRRGLSKPIKRGKRAKRAKRAKRNSRNSRL